MIKKIALVAIVLFGGTIRADAQTLKPVTDPARVFELLKNSSDKTTSILSDFTEEKTASYLKSPQKSAGKFYFKKSNKMRWEQNSPFQYTILINDDQLRVQENGKEKNVGAAKRMAGKMREMLLSLVSGDFQNSKAFLRECMQTDEHYVIILKPTDKRLRNRYASIRLSFLKKTLALRELHFEEPSGDRSTMKFFNEKINGNLSDELFQKF